MTRADIKLFIGENFEIEIGKLCNQNFLREPQLSFIGSKPTKLDDDIFTITEKGIDFVEDYNSRSLDRLETRLLKVTPILISLAALAISIYNLFYK